MRESKYTKHGVNKETYKLLFGEKEEYKKECSNEIYTIDLSSYYDRRFYLKLFIYLKKLMDMHFYSVNYFNIHKNLFSRGYTFKNKKTKFEFDYLEKYLRKILKNEDPYVRSELIWDLKHNLRHNTCFYRNLIIATNIEDSFFVTGLIQFEDGTSHLHSFVEYKEYVIDYTKNLIMPKKNYYELLRVKELQRMTSKNASKIYNIVYENAILNTDRYIATFGNEIMRDLEKNKCLRLNESTDKPDFSCFFF